MNKLDFSIKAGWPGSTETWEYLQGMILNGQNSALLGGKNYVLSGCVEAAGNVGVGIIVIDGEVLPFEGGPIQPKIIVVDEPVNRSFFGGASNPYYHNRKAIFGAGAGEVLYSDVKRNDPDNGVLQRLDKVERMLKPLMGYDVAGTTTYGSWLFWGRPAAEIPEGWEAVPDADWKGRVPVVLDATQVEFDTVGKVGGEKTVSLTVEQNAPHTHPVTPSASNSDGGFGKTTTGGDPTEGTGIATYQTGNSGSGAPHNNLQPYKVVLFIRFVG